MNIERLNFCTETAFNAMNANKHRWPKNIGDSLPRLFYGQVWAYNKNGIQSGAISEEAEHFKRLNPKKKGTYDHYLSPLSIASYIYDNADQYLNDWGAFREIFEMACATHRVTGGKGGENEILKQLTGKVLTKNKYKYLDIKLFKNGNEVDNTLITPAGYDEYEQQKYGLHHYLDGHGSTLPTLARYEAEGATLMYHFGI